MNSSKTKTTFELARAYPIGCTLNTVYSVTGILCSTGRYNLYRARDTRTGRTVTVKELTRAKVSKEAQADLFQSEIRALNRARHSNLPLMLDHFSDRGNLYIVFEHVTGMCLGEMLSAEGPLTAELVFPIFLEIADALLAAHEAGVIHNELTPSSIFLLGDNNSTQLAKLTDFGGATIKDDAVKAQAPKTFRPEYASPEALRGEETDERSDIYSIGVVLYTTLTGRLPFACEDINELIELQKGGLPRRFKETAPELDIPFHVEATVFKCLAKNKEDRFQSARELAKWMRSWRHSSGQVEPEPERPVAQVEKAYSLDELNSIATPKVSNFVAPAPVVTAAPLVPPTSRQPAATVKEDAAMSKEEAARLRQEAERLKEESARAKALAKEGDTKRKAAAREKAKAEARAKADIKAMEKEAAKLQERAFKKRAVPIYLFAAVMAGLVGFVATVNIRHAMNAKEAEREAFMLQERAPELSHRLIAATESAARQDESQTSKVSNQDSLKPEVRIRSSLGSETIGSAESSDLSEQQKSAEAAGGQEKSAEENRSSDPNAVNQEAPVVPVKPGEPVQFEGEAPYKQQPQNSEAPVQAAPQSVLQTPSVRTNIRSDAGVDTYQAPRRRRAYQTSYTSM